MTRVVPKGVSIAGVVVVLILLGKHIARQSASGFGPVMRQPSWLVLLAMLLLGDLIGYWTHRWFHGERLRNNHAVHRSSTQLDWLSALCSPRQ